MRDTFRLYNNRIIGETGLTLVNPSLQGISYWKDFVKGIIYIYVADEYKGDLNMSSSEGILEWIKIDDLLVIKQFDQNEKFTPYLSMGYLKENFYQMINAKC